MDASRRDLSQSQPSFQSEPQAKSKSKSSSFDLQEWNQSLHMENKAKYKLYELVEKGAKKTKWIRTIGALVGVASLCITVAFRVAAVGERLIKALGNIFGAPFSKKCKLLTGVKLLFIGMPLSAIAIPYASFIAVIGVALDTFSFALHPEAGAKASKEIYEEDVKRYNYEKAYERNKELEEEITLPEEEIAPE